MERGPGGGWPGSLFDVYADRQVWVTHLLNVAVHAQMVVTLGGQGIPASRIGPDELGRRLIDELTERAILPSGCSSTRSARPDAVVTLSTASPPTISFRIQPGTGSEFSADWKGLAGQCRAVCFSSLGQRSHDRGNSSGTHRRRSGCSTLTCGGISSRPT